MALEQASKISCIAEAACPRDLVDVAVVVQQELSRVAETTLMNGLRQSSLVDLMEDAAEVVGVAPQNLRQPRRAQGLMKMRSDIGVGPRGQPRRRTFPDARRGP